MQHIFQLIVCAAHKNYPSARAAIRRRPLSVPKHTQYAHWAKNNWQHSGPKSACELGRLRERLSGNFSVRTHNARGRRSHTSRTAGQKGRQAGQADCLCGCVAGIFRSKSCRVIKSAYYIITSSVAELGPRLCTQRERGADKQTERD